MKYKYAVLIGRFQPFHNEHLNLVTHALSLADKVILILGSHRSAPNFRNPWTADQRKEMIAACFKKEDRTRLLFNEARDQLYNDDLWLSEIQQKIREVAGEEPSNICLCGSYKDDTSYYLNFFPQWKFEGFPQNRSFSGATGVRESYFSHTEEWRSMVPGAVEEWLEEFKKTTLHSTLEEECKYVADYHKLWEHAPFPPTFVTTDVVLVKSGHVLMVRRGHSPGRGLLALPGGFLDVSEKIVDGAIRELYEETHLMSPRDEIRQFIVDKEVFDHPRRSLRGRTITHTFFIRLPGGGHLPAVQGGDDAVGAQWIPLGDLFLKEHEIFEDHLHQIEHFVRKI